MEQRDEIETMILNDGYIYNSKLWRQNITSQFLRHCYNKNTSLKNAFISYFIKQKPYAYIWETTTNEIKALSKIKDNNELKQRSRFFNKDVVLDICRQHKTTQNKSYAQKINMITNAENYKSIAKIMTSMHCFFGSTKPAYNKKPIAWQNAFIGSGIYHTMNHLIKFYNCRIYINDKPLNLYDSLDYLEKMTDDHKDNYINMFDIMETFLSQNKQKLEEKVIMFESENP